MGHTNAKKSLVKKKKDLKGRLTLRNQDSATLILSKYVFRGVNWISLAQDNDQQVSISEISYSA
jgi:hypothetical protein